MAAATQNTKNGAKVYDFQPIKFDVNAMEPEAQAGEYEAAAKVIKVGKTSKDNYPMLIIEWVLESAADDENEKSIGATVADFLAFFPEGNSKGKMGKLRLRQLCEKLDVDTELLPTSIEKKEDFEEFIRAVRNQRMTVWVTHRQDDSGETRVGVQYAAPKGAMSSVPTTDDDDDTPPPAKKAPVKKARR